MPGRAREAGEVRGPCRTRSRRFVAVDRPPRATGHLPQAAVPHPRTAGADSRGRSGVHAVQRSGIPLTLITSRGSRTTGGEPARHNAPFCSGLIVVYWRGMGPGSRALRALGRGHDSLSVFTKQQRIPGRGSRRLPGSEGHAARKVEIELPLTSPPQATSYRPLAAPRSPATVTTNYVPGNAASPTAPHKRRRRALNPDRHM